MPNSPLIAKAYDAGLIKVTDISDGVVGDLSTFRGTLQAYIALNVKALNQNKMIKIHPKIIHVKP